MTPPRPGNVLRLPVAPGFGERLRLERKAQGLTQTEMAGRCGVQRLAQSHYEREKSSPTVTYLAALSDTNVDVAYLVFGVRFTPSISAPANALLERQAFETVEELAKVFPSGTIGAEGRFALFRLIREQLQADYRVAHSDDLSAAEPTPVPRLLSEPS